MANENLLDTRGRQEVGDRHVDSEPLHQSQEGAGTEGGYQRRNDDTSLDREGDRKRSQALAEDRQRQEDTLQEAISKEEKQIAISNWQLAKPKPVGQRPVLLTPNAP